MSQNSIITVVLIVAAIAIGIYFVKSQNTSETEFRYEEEVSSRPDTAPDRLVQPDPVVEQPLESVTTEPLDSPPVPDESLATEIPPELVDPPAEGSPVENVMPVLTEIEYMVTIKGATTASKAFKIIFTDSNGEKVEADQDKLEDGIYKIDSEKKFVRMSIDINGYAPVLIDNIVIANNIANIEVVLEALAGFSGVVKNAAGETIAGAVVEIKKDLFSKKAYVDIQGKFSFVDLKEGSYNFKVSHPQYIDGNFVYELSKSQVRDLSLSLDKKPEIKSILLTEDNKPANEVTVILKQGETEINKSQTDENGAFEFTDLKEGAYTLFVSSKKGRLNAEVSLKNNQELSNKFQLVAPPSISGIMVDEAGKPTPKVKLFTFDDKEIIEVETDENGKFLLPLEKPANYRLLISGDKYESVNKGLKYQPSSEKIIFQVKEKKYFVGKVLTPSGVILRSDFEIVLHNRTKNTKTPIVNFKFKDDNFLIPLNYFETFGDNEILQLEIISVDFGGGSSLSFKAQDSNLGKETIISLGN